MGNSDESRWGKRHLDLFFKNTLEHLPASVWSSLGLVLSSRVCAGLSFAHSVTWFSSVVFVLSVTLFPSVFLPAYWMAALSRLMMGKSHWETASGLRRAAHLPVAVVAALWIASGAVSLWAGRSRMWHARKQKDKEQNSICQSLY